MDLFTDPVRPSSSLPLFVSSMTGGGVHSEDLNRRLAEAAQATGIGMAVGSQSLLLKDPTTAPSYQVRRWAPDILLFADLGLVHLNYGLDRAACVRAVEAIEADALMLYANHMHEAFQVAGDLDFSRLLERLGELAADFPYPIVVKEVGNGFSEATLGRLGQLPLAGVDVAGMGGTHWGRVEALMAGRALDSALEELGVPDGRVTGGGGSASCPHRYPCSHPAACGTESRLRRRWRLAPGPLGSGSPSSNGRRNRWIGCWSAWANSTASCGCRCGGPGRPTSRRYGARSAGVPEFPGTGNCPGTQVGGANRCEHAPRAAGRACIRPVGCRRGPGGAGGGVARPLLSRRRPEASAGPPSPYRPRP